MYLWLNHDDPLGRYGWAIPTATDIAFALGVLSLLGSRVPMGVKIFLMTLAILDDLGAIIVIAVFYTANLSVLSLVLAGLAVLVLVILNRRRVHDKIPYILVGAILWVCVLKSGVHATLAGVITALAIPWRGDEPAEQENISTLIEDLHPWVAFLILPAFAFVNTGISFSGMDTTLLFSSVPTGIALGLFLGKQIGVFVFAWAVLALGLTRKPDGVSLMQIYGVAVLCGIGFTMSIFIGGLAFEEVGQGYAGTDKLAIMAGSLLSGVLGYFILLFSCRDEPESS